MGEAVKFEALWEGEWVAVPVVADFEELYFVACVPKTGIPIRLVNANGDVVREFHPVRES